MANPLRIGGYGNQIRLGWGGLTAAVSVETLGPEEISEGFGRIV
jgi:hypothetical protein